VNPTFWLASFPKSGNTWFRIVVANLWSGSAEPVDINAIGSTDSIASSRHRLDNHLLVESALLSGDEVDELRPSFYKYAARGGTKADPDEDAVMPVRFVKTHDAYTPTATGGPMLAGADGAAGVILFVRDPRDVAGSFANHLDCPIDEAIGYLNDPDFCFADRPDRQHKQLRQRLLGWSGYAQSWLDQRDVPVHLVRYEDMLADPFSSVSEALRFCGIMLDPARLNVAIGFSSIDELQRQEAVKGFREAPRKSKSFFRRGVAGGWRDELSLEQVDRIERIHRPMMQKLGYQLSKPQTMLRSA
jgi:hypothetical protein